MRRARLLLAEGDGGLVAVVAVGDQERRVELDLVRSARARHACGRRPPRRPSRLAVRALEHGVGVVEQEDRLELRARRAQQAQAALLRAGVRPLVRQHLAGRVRRHRHRGGEALARAGDAVGADVVLRDPPVRRARPRRGRPARARRARSSAACCSESGSVRWTTLYGLRARYSSRASSEMTSYGGATSASSGPATCRVVAERANGPDGRHSCSLVWAWSGRLRSSGSVGRPRSASRSLFPKADLVLPSLWEQVNGSPSRTGRSAIPTAASSAGVSRWRSSGARRTSCRRPGSACVGKHLARVVGAASRRASSRRSSPREPRAAPEGSRRGRRRRSRDHGPLTGPRAPRARPGATKKDGRPGGRVAAPRARPHDLAPRRAGRPVGRARPRPARPEVAAAGDSCLPRDDARRELAVLVLAQAGELTAADLARRPSAGGGRRRRRSSTRSPTGRDDGRASASGPGRRLLP